MQLCFYHFTEMTFMTNMMYPAARGRMARNGKGEVNIPVRRAPQQERSRETEALILRTTEELLQQGHDFRDIKVTDIAFACGVTTGAIYARFRNKEAIVDSLIQEVYIKGLRERVLPTLSSENCEGLKIREIVRGYLGAEANLYRDHDALGRLFSYLAGSEKVMSQCRRDLVAYNVEMSGMIRARILERAHNIGHPDPDYAIDLAEHVTDYALQRKIFMEMAVSPHSNVSAASDERLVEELTEIFVSYLRVSE
jgi:AcrR family transcriptional regulator